MMLPERCISQSGADINLMLPEASLKEVAETNISFSNIEYLSKISLYNIKTDNKTSIMLLKYLPY